MTEADDEELGLRGKTVAPETFARGSRSRAADRRVRVLGVPVDSYPRYAPESQRGAVRRITEVGEDVLRRPSREVTEFGVAELSRLIDDMFLTMYVAEGAGLAANQVDVDLRLFVYDCTDDDGVRHVGHLVNPVVEQPEWDERRLIEGPEGCLSVPGAGITVARTDPATARGFDQAGNPLEIGGTGQLARCLQHETDHVNGRLYLDRLSARDRREALRQTAERREQVFARRATRAANLPL
jgi:peptide deformylase